MLTLAYVRRGHHRNRRRLLPLAHHPNHTRYHQLIRNQGTAKPTAPIVLICASGDGLPIGNVRFAQIEVRHGV
jgi:hypothetical protein